MKKIIRKIYLIFIVLVLFLAGTVLGTDTEFKEPEYTEVYKQWLRLSDEEKENAIEPSKYSFNLSKTNKEIQLSNQNANLKRLLRMTKSSAYSSDNYFSLQNSKKYKFLLGFCYNELIRNKLSFKKLL